MIVRAVTSRDLTAIAALHAASFDRGWPADELWDLASRTGAVALLAAPRLGPEAEGPPLGFILCWTVAGEAEILTLAVDPTHRRKGIAKAVLDAALRACGEAGAEALWLEVAEDNAAALALYRAAGFGEGGRRPGYYRRPGSAAVDALVLRRRLTGTAQPLIVG